MPIDESRCLKTEAMPIKGVLFDVHDTLIIKDYRASALANTNALAVLQQAGHNVTAEDYATSWKQASRLARQDAQEMGEVTVQGWYDSILSGIGIRDYSPDLIEKMNDAFNQAFTTATRALPHSKGVLRRLKRAYRLGVVSNSLAPNTVNDMKVAGIVDFFEVIVISSDFGKRKPHPSIYLCALDKLGLEPGEAVFVGDNPYEDIYGAKEIGMRTVLINHPLVERERRLRSRPPLQIGEVCGEPDARIRGLDQLETVLQNMNNSGKDEPCLAS